MERGGHRAGRPWLAAGLAVAITVAATVGILVLRDYSDDRREGQVILGEIEAAADRQALEVMSLLGLGLAADQAQAVEVRRATVERKLAVLETRSLARFDELTELGFEGTPTQRARASFDELQRTLHTAMELLEDDQADAAYIFGLRRIAPAFQDIEVAMADAASWYGQVARRANVVADAGSTVTIAIGLLLFLALRWRLDRQRTEFEERLRHEAMHDALTDLPNRRMFRDQVEQACQRYIRSGHAAAVMYIDLDGFKGVNDALGHECGDRVLVEVAGRLRSSVRGSDSVGRIGGDEFAVLLVDVENLEEVEFAARRILKAISLPFTVEGHAPVLGASIGATLLESPDQTMEDLMASADEAMYRAKHHGKGRIEFAARYAPRPTPESSPGAIRL